MVEYCKYTARLPGLWQDNIHHFCRADRTGGVTLQHEVPPRLSMLVPPSHSDCWPRKGPGRNSGYIFKLSCAVERRRGKPVHSRLAEQWDLPLMAAFYLATFTVRQNKGAGSIAPLAVGVLPQHPCRASAAQDSTQWGVRSLGCYKRGEKSMHVNDEDDNNKHYSLKM